MAEQNYAETGIVASDDTSQPSQATYRSVDDIVTRLRERAMTWLPDCYSDAELDTQAADEIERLRRVADELARVMRESETLWVADEDWDAALSAYDESGRG